MPRERNVGYLGMELEVKLGSESELGFQKQVGHQIFHNKDKHHKIVFKRRGMMELDLACWRSNALLLKIEGRVMIIYLDGVWEFAVEIRQMHSG